MKNSNSQFVNPHFDLIRLWLQENIGKFIVGLLVLTYLATGFFIGIALQKGLTPFGVAISWIAGMSIAIIGQCIRGSLVYFSQANPYRLGGNAHVFGTAAALLLTIWAGYEVVHLLSAVDVPAAFRISIVGVVIAGFFVEVFFLNELQKINHAVLVNDPELYQQALNNEHLLAEIKIAMIEARVKLVHARRNRLRQALDSRDSTSTLPSSAQQEDVEAPPVQTGYLSQQVMNAIGASYKLDAEQMASIRKFLQAGSSDEDLLRLIEGYSEKNRRDERSKPQIITEGIDELLASIAGNGNGNGVKKP